jgi:hypothetical protein
VRQKAERKQPLSTLRCYTFALAVVLNGCKLWVKAVPHVRKAAGSPWVETWIIAVPLFTRAPRRRCSPKFSRQMRKRSRI